MATTLPLLDELEPVVAQLLDRHLEQSTEWFPHELVPWGRGRDVVAGEPWDPDEVALPDAVRSSLVVNLLTEDNLPYYLRTMQAMFGRDSAWGDWSRRWTAEEGRHSIVLRDYLTVTRAVDPVALERARMAQVSCGQVPEPPTPHDAILYVALQELATRVSHFNTGKQLDDPAGYEVMKRVAADENLHHLFYRDLCSAAFELDPSAMVIALERQLAGFAMPGTGIVDFDRHAKAIARAGIYDFAVHHELIVRPMVTRRWRIADLQGLTAEAERARDAVLAFVDRLGRAARRLTERRATLAPAG